MAVCIARGIYQPVAELILPGNGSKSLRTANYGEKDNFLKGLPGWIQHHGTHTRRGY